MRRQRCTLPSLGKVKRKKRFLFYVAESPKPYFQQANGRTVSLSPQHPEYASIAENSTRLSHHPELNASQELSPGASRYRTRIARTVVQPANHCATDYPLLLLLLLLLLKHQCQADKQAPTPLG